MALSPKEPDEVALLQGQCAFCFCRVFAIKSLLRPRVPGSNCVESSRPYRGSTFEEFRFSERAYIAIKHNHHRFVFFSPN